MGNDEYVSQSKEFRQSILAMMLFTDWMARYGTTIQPEYFPSKSEQEIVTWLNWYYTTYKAIPTDADIDNGLDGNELLDDIYSADNSQLQYAADMVLEFSKTQAMKLAILASVDDIRDGDFSKIRNRIEDALLVGTDRMNLGMDLIDDSGEWMYDELHGRRFPTGWPTVDSILEGGLVAGEYGLIMAPTGRGKTTALINIGYAMAGLMGATNVLHVTLEMPPQKILKRYALRTTGRAMERGGNVGLYRKLLESRAKKNLRAHIRVSTPDRNVQAIRVAIDNLSVVGFDVGALIVDYADLLVPERRRRELRFELADITRDLRALGEDYGIPVWSATQAGRQALYKEVITVADISEAIEKAAIADVIIAICQTRDEESLGRGRLFMAKVRDAKSGVFVPVKIDFSKQAIVQRGKLEARV